MVFMSISICEGAGTEMTIKPVNPPETVNGWTKSNSSRIVLPKNIFEYMNGGGELYLAYRFDHLSVHHYEAKGQDKILVEIYQMKTADDAFGLLSLDWGGEPLIFTPSAGKRLDPVTAQAPRAFYGSGLLRMWSGTLYTRIMAYRETPEARETVISLGKTIAADRSKSPPPEILTVFPGTVAKNWKLRNDRISFFRSHLVFNSIYFLSFKNILDLDHSTEAVTAPYENSPKPAKKIQTLIIKYPSPINAKKAVNHFHDAYLSEHAKPSEHGRIFIVNIEDGWLGYQLSEKCLTIVFEAPDRKTAREIVETVSCNAIN